MIREKVRHLCSSTIIGVGGAFGCLLEFFAFCTFSHTQRFPLLELVLSSKQQHFILSGSLVKSTILLVSIEVGKSLCTYWMRVLSSFTVTSYGSRVGPLLIAASPSCDFSPSCPPSGMIFPELSRLHGGAYFSASAHGVLLGRRGCGVVCRGQDVGGWGGLWPQWPCSCLRGVAPGHSLLAMD